MSETGTSSMESLLLSVSLEVRIKIYKLALDTGTIDSITKSRASIIKDHRALRTAPSRVRINDYCLVNVSSKSTALEQTRAQIKPTVS
jgi:hypothetical protein